MTAQQMPDVQMAWETPEDCVAIVSVGEVTVTMSSRQLEDLITECERVLDEMSLGSAAAYEADRSEAAHEAAVDAELLGGA